MAIFINDIPVEINRYPDGTFRIEFDMEKVEESEGDYFVKWLYEPNEELPFYFAVKQLKLNTSRHKTIVLDMPYCPYAREDKWVGYDRAFSLKFFSELINSLEFEEVWIEDAHSSVCLALIDRAVDHKYYVHKVEKLIDKLKPELIFYPDQGAYERYMKAIKIPEGVNTGFGIKLRDPYTGKITGYECDHFTNYNVLIVDNICSKGTTYLLAAEQLKHHGHEIINLYCTHIESSILEGELIKSGLLEKIYTTDSIWRGEHHLIEVL